MPTSHGDAATPAAAASDASAVTVARPLSVGGMSPVGPTGPVAASTSTDAPIDGTVRPPATAPAQDRDADNASDDDSPADASRRRTFPTSFDCGQATHDNERAICSDPGLAAMDVEMDRLYAAALLASPRPRALAQSQRDWLVSRDMCDGDPDCLREAYGERLGQFHASLNSPPLMPDGDTADGP